ncbi:DMT family transporter [Cohaesibacter celericrescens]|uniref:DMT family transporter n=1 Tax=Cohaesibacter celericrescens TaxID=2067669 RepID=UPI0035699BCA
MRSPTIRKPTAVDLALMLFLTIVWSSSFVAIKVAVPQTGPVWLAAIRVCIGFAVLLPWAFYRGFMLPKSVKNWAFLVAISLFNVTLPFLLISWAELTVSAGMASLLLGTGPLLALVLSHVTTEDDKINRFKLMGIALGFSGIALVVGREALAHMNNGILAQLAILGASLCYALSGAMIRQVKDVPPTRLATLILGLSSVELIALGLAQGLPDFTAIAADGWVSLIFLGLLPTGLATILRYRLIWAVGASFFGLGMNLIPIFGVIMGAILLSEHVPLTTWLALGLIIAGLLVARMPPRANK